MSGKRSKNVTIETTAVEDKDAIIGKNNAKVTQDALDIDIHYLEILDEQEKMYASMLKTIQDRQNKITSQEIRDKMFEDKFQEMSNSGIADVILQEWNKLRKSVLNRHRGVVPYEQKQLECLEEIIKKARDKVHGKKVSSQFNLYDAMGSALIMGAAVSTMFTIQDIMIPWREAEAVPDVKTSTKEFDGPRDLKQILQDIEAIIKERNEMAKTVENTIGIQVQLNDAQTIQMTDVPFVLGQTELRDLIKERDKLIAVNAYKQALIYQADLLKDSSQNAVTNRYMSDTLVFRRVASSAESEELYSNGEFHVLKRGNKLSIEPCPDADDESGDIWVRDSLVENPNDPTSAIFQVDESDQSFEKVKTKKGTTFNLNSGDIKFTGIMTGEHIPASDGMASDAAKEFLKAMMSHNTHNPVPYSPKENEILRRYRKSQMANSEQKFVIEHEYVMVRVTHMIMSEGIPPSVKNLTVPVEEVIEGTDPFDRWLKYVESLNPEWYRDKISNMTGDSAHLTKLRKIFTKKMKLAQKELTIDPIAELAMSASNMFNLYYWKHPITGAIKVVYKIPFMSKTYTKELEIGGPGMELPGQQTLLKSALGGMMAGAMGGMMGNRSSAFSMAAGNVEPFKSAYERDEEGRKGTEGMGLSVAQVGLSTLAGGSIDLVAINERYEKYEGDGKLLHQIIVRDEPGIQSAFSADLTGLKWHEFGTVGIEWLWSHFPAEIKAEIRQWAYTKFMRYIKNHELTDDNFKTWKEKMAKVYKNLKEHLSSSENTTNKLENTKQEIAAILSDDGKPYFNHLSRKNFIESYNAGKLEGELPALYKKLKQNTKTIKDLELTPVKSKSILADLKAAKKEKAIIERNYAAVQKKLLNLQKKYRVLKTAVEMIDEQNKKDMNMDKWTRLGKKGGQLMGNIAGKVVKTGGEAVKGAVNAMTFGGDWNEPDSLWAFSIAMAMGGSLGITLNQVCFKLKGGIKEYVVAPLAGMATIETIAFGVGNAHKARRLPILGSIMNAIISVSKTAYGVWKSLKSALWDALNRWNPRYAMAVYTALHGYKMNIESLETMWKDRGKLIKDMQVALDTMWQEHKQLVDHISIIEMFDDYFLNIIGQTNFKQTMYDMYLDVLRKVHFTDNAKPERAMNYQFVGNPGTGKTEAAKKMSKFLFLSRLRTGNFGNIHHENISEPSLEKVRKRKAQGMEELGNIMEIIMSLVAAASPDKQPEGNNENTTGTFMATAVDRFARFGMRCNRALRIDSDSMDIFKSTVEEWRAYETEKFNDMLQHGTEKSSMWLTSAAELLLEGQTAAKQFRKKIAHMHANGGGTVVLDEAYSLKPASDPNGRQVYDILLLESENKKKTMTFIMIGYENDIAKELMAFNPGMGRRFPNIIKFRDFNANHMRQYWKLLLKKSRRYKGADILKPVRGWAMKDVDIDLVVSRLKLMAKLPGFGNVVTEQQLFNRAAVTIVEIGRAHV